MAFGVHKTKVGLSISLPLVSSKAIPFENLFIVLRNTLAVPVHHTKIILSPSLPLFSS